MPWCLQTEHEFFTSLCINEISSQPVRQGDLQHEAEDVKAEQLLSWNCNIIDTHLKKRQAQFICWTVEKDQGGIHLK